MKCTSRSRRSAGFFISSGSHHFGVEVMSISRRITVDQYGVVAAASHAGRATIDASVRTRERNPFVNSRESAFAIFAIGPANVATCFLTSASAAAFSSANWS